MTDDDSDEHPGGTWYGRLRRVLKGDAATREDLLDWLRKSHAQTVLDADELAMLEGVLGVSETQVRDVMVPRSQMAVLERDAPRDEVLKAIVEGYELKPDAVLAKGFGDAENGRKVEVMIHNRMRTKEK